MMRWALALMVYTLASTGVGTAAQPVPAIGSYVHAVHGIRVRLDRLAVSPAVSSSAIQALQRDLRALRTVRLPDGGVMHTGMPLLAAQLGSDRASRQGVASALDALDAGLSYLPRRPANEAEFRALDDVLRDPRFHPSCKPLACLVEWITNHLPSLRLNAPFPGLPAIPARPFAVLFLLLLFFIVFLIVRGALTRTVVTILPSGPSGEERIAAPHAQAAQLAEAGKYREALHYLFLATLLALHRQRGLPLQPGLTNRELLHAAGESGAYLLESQARRAALQDLIEEFDRAWYGHLPFGAADYSRCEALARRTLAANEQDAA